MKAINAFDQLRKDHKAIKDLFNQFQKSTNTEEKSEIALMVFRELKLHSALEEEIFYPLLDAHLEIGDLIGEALDEHQTVSVLIEELEDLDIEQEHFAVKFFELTESIKHHIKEEETKIIPIAESNLDREDVAQLNSEMAERRQTLAKEIIKESSTRLARARTKRRSPLVH